jgi:hypothetical protein
VATTIEARTLQGSALRRIWSTLLDYRDWASYVYVPLVVPILVLMPYVIAQSYQHSKQVHRLIKSLAQGSRDLEEMSRLMESSPTPWQGEAFEEVRSFEALDLTGFKILQDSRIIDLRSWKPFEPEKHNKDPLAYVYRRLKASKLPENAGNNLLRIPLMPTSPKTAIRFPPQQLQPRIRMSPLQSAPSDEKSCRWEVCYDFQRVPAGEFIDLFMEEQSPGRYLKSGQNGAAVPFAVHVETDELTTWLLMPEGREYERFRIVRYQTGKPDKVEPVKVVTEYLADDYTIIAFKLLALKSGYTYELSWSYR